MELAVQVQTVDKVVCVSLYTKDIEKGMNRLFSLPAMGK